MVCCCFMVLMQLFEIFDEIMYPLRIKKLGDGQRRNIGNWKGSLTLRITWEGSVLSIDLIYWAMALS